jgi:hypothetical protein
MALLAAGPADTEDNASGPQGTTAEPSEKTEEQLQKTTEEASKPRRKPRPEPHVPRARILWILKKDHGEARSTTVRVEILPSGCRLAVGYRTPFVGSTLPSEPPDYYEAIYTDPELRSQICFVRTNAYGTKSDDYGNKRRVLLLRTSRDRATAQKINWRNTWDVNFQNLYRTEYVHPSVTADIRREQAREAVDCVEDQGFFDFDELHC